MGVRATLIAAVLFAPAAFGSEARIGDIEISGAWARATPPAARVGAVYLNIVNRGSHADRLTGITTPQADKAEIHETSQIAGVMQMRQVAFLECPPGVKVAISPGGTHIMLVGLKSPLALSAQFPLTLTFREAGSITLTVAVEAGDT